MLNALYLTAERLGIDILTTLKWLTSIYRTGCSVCIVKRDGGVVEVRALRWWPRQAASNHIEWLKQYGVTANNFPDPRDPYNRGTILKMLLDKGVLEVGDPRNVTRLAIDARAQNLTAVLLPVSTAWSSASSSTRMPYASTTKERTSGQALCDLGAARRGAAGQIAYIIFDSTVLNSFMPHIRRSKPMVSPSWQQAGN